MAEEINQKWLQVSIERGGKEVHSDEYRKDSSSELGLLPGSQIELTYLVIEEFEKAIVQANQYNKRHLEIKFIY